MVISGNLIFIPTTNIDGTGGCEITNDYGNYLRKMKIATKLITNFDYAELLEIAEIAQLDPAILLNCLTKADHNWRYSDTESDSDIDAMTASKIRKCLCRTLYGRLFTWIVGKINESLKVISFFFCSSFHVISITFSSNYI